MSVASSARKYCVCNFRWCCKKVDGGPDGSGHRLSNLVPRGGDTTHLGIVLRQHLMVGASEDAIQAILQCPRSRRVHSWHFSDEDKMPGQGGGLKLRLEAIPLARSEIPGARVRTAPKTPAAPLGAQRPPRTPGTCLAGTARLGETPGSGRSGRSRVTTAAEEGRREDAPRRVTRAQKRAMEAPPVTPAAMPRRRALATPTSATPTSAAGSSRQREQANRDITQFDIGAMDEITLRRHARELAKRLDQARKLEEDVRISRVRQRDQDAENLRKALEELSRKNAENARLAAALEEARQALAQRNAELERVARTSGVVLSWETVMDPESPWEPLVTDLTGLPSTTTLSAVFDWIDCCGLSSKLKLWHHNQTTKRMDIEEAGEEKWDMSGHTDKKISPRDSLLLTLTKLKTGISFRLLTAWFGGIPYTTCVRIFSTWIPYVYHFFATEFPPPNMETLRGTTPRQWIRVYGGEPKYVIDATDYRMQQPSSRMAARTVWSDYKHGHTIKLLVCIVPAGAFVWSSDGYPGRISDIEICETSGFYEVIEEGDLIAADNGLDGCAIPSYNSLLHQKREPRHRHGHVIHWTVS